MLFLMDNKYLGERKRRHFQYQQDGDSKPFISFEDLENWDLFLNASWDFEFCKHSPCLRFTRCEEVGRAASKPIFRWGERKCQELE